MAFISKEKVTEHLESAAITFVATFAFFFCGLVMADNTPFTWDAMYAASLGAFVAATRAVAKIIYQWAYAYLSSRNK